MDKKQKMLVRTDPRVVMPEGFGQAKPPTAPAAGAKPSGPTVVTVDKPVQVKSLHNFLAGLQYDVITHFRREKYQMWPTAGLFPVTADVACDEFTVPIGTALVLTCVRYRAVSSYTISGSGTVAYFLQDEALMPYYLTNPPPAKAIRTTINGVSIASQQFIYVRPLPFGDTIVDGYYTLNQNIIPPGYTMQTIATENQEIKTLILNPGTIKASITDSLDWLGIEYYGFTLPMTVWNRFKMEYAP